MSLRRSPKAKAVKAAAKTPTTRARAKAPTSTPVPPVVTTVQLRTPRGTITLSWPAPGSKALATLQAAREQGVTPIPLGARLQLS